MVATKESVVDEGFFGHVSFGRLSCFVIVFIVVYNIFAVLMCFTSYNAPRDAATIALANFLKWLWVRTNTKTISKRTKGNMFSKTDGPRLGVSFWPPNLVSYRLLRSPLPKPRFSLAATNPPQASPKRGVFAQVRARMDGSFSPFPPKAKKKDQDQKKQYSFDERQTTFLKKCLSWAVVQSKYSWQHLKSPERAFEMLKSEIECMSPVVPAASNHFDSSFRREIIFKPWDTTKAQKNNSKKDGLWK